MIVSNLYSESLFVNKRGTAACVQLFVVIITLQKTINGVIIARGKEFFFLASLGQNR